MTPMRARWVGGAELTVAQACMAALRHGVPGAELHEEGSDLVLSGAWPDGLTVALPVPEIEVSIGLASGELVVEVPRMLAAGLLATTPASSVKWGKSSQVRYALTPGQSVRLPLRSYGRLEVSVS